MSQKKYEDAEIVVELKNDIFYVIIKDKVVVTKSVSSKMISERIRLSEGKSYPTITDATKIKYWTMDSRNSDMKDKAFDLILFSAIIISNTAARIMWDFTLRLFPMPIKFKVVATMEQAENWIQEQKSLM